MTRAGLAVALSWALSAGPSASQVPPAPAASLDATRASTAHLDVTAYANRAPVAPGSSVSLVLEVIPRRRMHVYAPGAKGYRVVSLEIAPHPYLTPGRTRYPASEPYHFRPLDERVPVYQVPFRLTRDVALDGGPRTRRALRGQERLTITGSLEYQACDDAVCYNPVSVPVAWTLRLAPPAAPASRGPR